MLGSDRSTSVWGTSASRGPAERPLNAVLYKAAFTDFHSDPGPDNRNWLADTELELREYRCPSDRGYTNFHDAAWRDSGLSSYDHYGNSYAANTLVHAHGAAPGRDGLLARVLRAGRAPVVAHSKSCPHDRLRGKRRTVRVRHDDGQSLPSPSVSLQRSRCPCVASAGLGFQRRLRRRALCPGNDERGNLASTRPPAVSSVALREGRL